MNMTTAYDVTPLTSASLDGTDLHDRRKTMLLLPEELARAHMYERLREASEQRAAAGVRRLRRAERRLRRAERAHRRARQALAHAALH
jgi:hypothetical protein